MTLSLQLGTNPDMQLAVPFLVTSEKLSHPVTGFNAVKVIASSHQECSLVNMFCSAIVSKNKDQIKSFAKVLKFPAEDSKESVVKIRGGKIILGAGNKLLCLDERRLMIPQQSKFELPERICCMDFLVILKKKGT